MGINKVAIRLPPFCFEGYTLKDFDPKGVNVFCDTCIYLKFINLYKNTQCLKSFHYW